MKTKEQILNDSFLPKLFNDCVKMQNNAIGKIQVGCVLEAMDYSDDVYIGGSTFLFYGANLHISDSFADIHAEQLAINLAILKKCYPITIYVTSTSKDEDVFLCGQCRQYICEVNENCNVVIFNPDGSVKRIGTISEYFPYHKDVKNKNQKFYELCGGKGLQSHSTVERKEI